MVYSYTTDSSSAKVDYNELIDLIKSMGELANCWWVLYNIKQIIEETLDNENIERPL